LKILPAWAAKKCTKEMISRKKKRKITKHLEERMIRGGVRGES